MKTARKLPPWLRRPFLGGETYTKVDKILNSLELKTICENANCPNRGECYNRGTESLATFVHETVNSAR
ncbi:MAG: hypothetical protein ACYS5F_06100 [Planctomycetota bacterium]|jgi:lipoic acid synthetase